MKCLKKLICYTWSFLLIFSVVYFADNRVFASQVLQNEIKAKSAVMASNILIGTEMPKLDFADDNIVIFHEYFGIFVYDLKTKKISKSLDLAEIGCEDENIKIEVSKKAAEIYITPSKTNGIYVWNLKSGTLQKEIRGNKKEIFTNYIDNIEIEKKKGKLNAKSFLYSKKAIYFTDKDYGQLYVPNIFLRDITYKRNGKEWKIFSNENDKEQLLKQQDAYYKEFKNKAEKSKQDFYECYNIMLSRSDFAGIAYLSDNVEYSDEKQLELSQYNIVTSGEEIEGDEEESCFKLYITVTNWKEMNLKKESYVKYITIKRGESGWYTDGLPTDTDN